MPGTPPIVKRNGSSKITVGWPDRIAATKPFISCTPIADGCTARRTSQRFSGSPGLGGAISSAGLTCTTSYCLRSSWTSSQSGVGPDVHYIPLQFGMTLNRAGCFTIELTATDGTTGKTAHVEYQIRVLDLTP